MRLDKVTVTGADDSISPESLIELSMEFPFVEWGILLSRSQQGKRRFPSHVWLEELASVVRAVGPGDTVHTAGHLCGAWLRELLMGQDNCPYFDLGIFERLQLNFHAEDHKVDMDAFLRLLKIAVRSGRHVIFQYDGVNSYLLMRSLADGIKGLEALFDLSHGAGITPAEWPAPIPYVDYCGYAGGLGPDNLREGLDKISNVAGNRTIWIDTETKMRGEGDSQFDLDKVREFLSIAREFMLQSSVACKGKV
ncbi:MAG: hypothetical protein ACLQF0_09165 [Dissulfurispiraceae bacterium]